MSYNNHTSDHYSLSSDRQNTDYNNTEKIKTTRSFLNYNKSKLVSFALNQMLSSGQILLSSAIKKYLINNEENILNSPNKSHFYKHINSKRSTLHHYHISEQIKIMLQLMTLTKLNASLIGLPLCSLKLILRLLMIIIIFSPVERINHLLISS